MPLRLTEAEYARLAARTGKMTERPLTTSERHILPALLPRRPCPPSLRVYDVGANKTIVAPATGDPYVLPGNPTNQTIEIYHRSRRGHETTRGGRA